MPAQRPVSQNSTAHNPAPETQQGLESETDQVRSTYLGIAHHHTSNSHKRAPMADTSRHDEKTPLDGIDRSNILKRP